MRKTFRFRNYRLTPDQEETPVLAMECTGCGKSSDGSENANDGTQWAVDHLKANPGHLRFREIITRAYKFIPEGWL
ncbi:hypothetical protein [Streptomyces chrestomyceticus]|uniref:DUF7848 domain-containing protein n=1 Tax=Streptomyces chrestomyceticus TaxID=68185 RepID=UPI003403150E